MIEEIVLASKLRSVGFKHHKVIRKLCRHVYINKQFYLGRFYVDVYDPDSLDFDEPGIVVTNPVYALGEPMHSRRTSLTRVTPDMQINSQTPMILSMSADVSDLNTYKG